MGKIAFLFPGQGSQKVGMGQEIALAHAEAASIYHEADQVLGFELSQLSFAGPEDQLKKTEYAQPAILTASMALYRIMANNKIVPDYVAGHSLGEYSALVAANSLSFSDAVQTVHYRGQIMEKAVPSGQGAMMAILNLDREQVDAICQEVRDQGGAVEVANYNSPVQVVISGEKEAVKIAGEKALAAGARKAVSLSVSGPFHSSLMQPATKPLAEKLAGIPIQPAQYPLLANCSAQPITQPDQIRASLVKQVASPVLWEDSIRFLIDQGVDTFVEIGPGRVLSGLVKKVDRKVSAYSIQDQASLDKTLDVLIQMQGS